MGEWREREEETKTRQRMEVSIGTKNKGTHEKGTVENRRRKLAVYGTGSRQRV